MRHILTFEFDSLESRALLTAATESFTAPDLSALIAEARKGKNIASAAIDAEISALHAQLVSGPLADLQAATVDGADFNTEVSNLVTSFESAVDSALSPAFPNVDSIIKLQAEALASMLASLDVQTTDGLISGDDETTDAATVIDDITTGPLLPLGTTLADYRTATTTFEGYLGTAVSALDSTSTPSLTLTQTQAILDSEVAAYQAAVQGSLSVLHPNLYRKFTAAMTELANTIDNPGTDPATAYAQAETDLDALLLGSGGLFASDGTAAKVLK